LWTSDVEGSRVFYSELFGWHAEEPSPEFGGYFMFTRGGIPVAGAMGDMGDMSANDTWKIYLATSDIAETVRVGAEAGAQIMFAPEPVSDLGIQTVFNDVVGATLGAWQAGTFPGFTVMEEHGSPSWFELHTRQHADAVAFYETVFGLGASVMANGEDFRYTALVAQDGTGVAGVTDATSVLPDGAPPYWITYWDVDDIVESITKVRALGGKVVRDVEDSPYGRIATVTDPNGAFFKLRTTPSST
jgi:predicted enzyme related to lactoylglutathione lyase